MVTEKPYNCNVHCTDQVQNVAAHKYLLPVPHIIYTSLLSPRHKHSGPDLRVQIAKKSIYAEFFPKENDLYTGCVVVGVGGGYLFSVAINYT